MQQVFGELDQDKKGYLELGDISRDSVPAEVSGFLQQRFERDGRITYDDFVNEFGSPRPSSPATPLSPPRTPQAGTNSHISTNDGFSRARLGSDASSRRNRFANMSLDVYQAEISDLKAKLMRVEAEKEHLMMQFSHQIKSAEEMTKHATDQAEEQLQHEEQKHKNLLVCLSI